MEQRMTTCWPNCRNARDLGGLPTTDGRQIVPGALLRSDNHDRLTTQGIRAIRDSGVSRILDLRWEWESTKYPSPFAGDPLYRNVPLIDEEGEEGKTLIDTYRLMIDNSQRSIATAFQAVADAPPGGVLVHCHSGKDRTGVLVALALMVAGVTADVAAADYALTDGCLPQTMLETLAHVEHRHGGIDAYLSHGGLLPGHLTAVQTRLLPPRC
jgi:protein-tyrosine phosphatase